MIGKQDRWQEDLFVAGPLSALIPDDHILKRLAAVLLCFLRFAGRHFVTKRFREFRSAAREEIRGKVKIIPRKIAA